MIACTNTEISRIHEGVANGAVDGQGNDSLAAQIKEKRLQVLSSEGGLL
jgi:hypothetical protein